MPLKYTNPAIEAANAAVEADRKARSGAATPPPVSTPDLQPSTPPESVPSSPPPETTSAPTVTATTVDWRALLDTADEKELAKHPRVSGLVGSLAERQAKKLADQAVAAALAARDARDAEKQTHADELARRQLLAADPYKFRDAELKRIADQDAAQTAANARIAGLQRSAQELVLDLDLPQTDLDELSGKNYPGDADAGYRAFVREAVSRAAKHAAAKQATAALTAHEKELRASERAAVLAEINGGEPSPDVSTGSPRVKQTIKDIGAMTQADYQKLGRTPQERFAALGLH